MSSAALDSTMAPSGIRRGARTIGLDIAGWFTLPLVLWALLWLAINTDPSQIIEPSADLNGIVSGLRAAFPLIALAVAVPSILSGISRRRRSWAETGFWIYGTVMIVSSTDAVPWFYTAYWGFAFVAALAVVELGLQKGDPYEFIVRLNWLSWLVTTATLVTLLIIARDVLIDPSTQSGYGFINRFQEAHNGAVISRETGLSRMAAVPAVISLVFLFSGRSWQRLVSLAVFGGSAYIIWIMQSRGALLAFAGAFLFVLLLGDKKQQKIAAALVVLLFLAGAMDVLSDQGLGGLWGHVTRGTGAEGFLSMSGRDYIWQDMLEHWRSSPLFGYGAQADRLFGWNGQNALIYAMVCTGVVGTVPFVAAMVSSWRALILLITRLRSLSASERRMVEITGAILVFSTLRSYPENNAALFSVDLLLQYPAMIYLVVLSSKRTVSRLQRTPIGIS